MKTLNPVMVTEAGMALQIKNLPAFRTGVTDGFEQGFDLSTGMSYDDPSSQWAYDTGTYIGACLAVREE